MMSRRKKRIKILLGMYFILVVLGILLCTAALCLPPKTIFREASDGKASDAATAITVPYLAQNPQYPTGCESVSAVMLLRYYGKSITVDTFIDRYLPCADFYMQNGERYGPDPNRAFIGDPRTRYGFGCYAPVIKTALEAYLGSGCVQNTTGETLPALCKSYIDNKRPVLVWASQNGTAIIDGAKWRLPDGTPFTWRSGEHCLVLVGYDDTHYYFNDPLAGAAVGYPKAAVENAFAALGKQSLVLVV